MKTKTLAVFAALSIASASLCAGEGNIPELFDRPGGLVPDKQTAIRIAEAVLFPIYGEKDIRKERPYQVWLSDGKWVVEGGPLPRGFTGGVFHVVIRQRDACVLEIGHGA